MTDIVNYYAELLGNDKDMALPAINEKLNRLKLELGARVTRPSSQQEAWLRDLKLIDQALVVFKDDQSRAAYDDELRRAGAPTESEKADIDWTARAWNYYWADDNGAATVAVRKAKEQSPKSAMPFVVSAWVRLVDREWKQAKADADEAFVMDEQVEDSVDVEMVRGAAYYFMGVNEDEADPSNDFQRALTSLDKALAKASPPEQAEAYRWKALTYVAMNDWSSVYDCGIRGLSTGGDIAEWLRHGLAKLTSDSITTLCEPNGTSGGSISAYDAQNLINAYSAKKAEIQQSAVDPQSKADITAIIDANLNRFTSIVNLQAQYDAANQQRNAVNQQLADANAALASAQSVQPPKGSKPGLPWVTIGIAVLLLIGGLGSIGTSIGSGAFFIIVAVIVGAVAASKSNKPVQWNRAAAAYQTAQQDAANLQGHIGAMNQTLAGIEQQMSALNAQISHPQLTQPIWMED